VLRADGTLTTIRRSEVVGTLRDLPKKSQAQAFLESRLHDLNHNARKPQSLMHFGDFVLSQWEPAIYPTLKFATSRNYKNLVRRHLLPAFGDEPLVGIKRQAIQGFVVQKMLREKYSWKTTLNLRNLLGTIFATAESWDYVTVNPARGVKLPARPLDQAGAFLTVEEVNRLVLELEEPARSISVTAVLTGMRIGELLALRWSNVDFERRVIRVRETVYESHVSTPKTRSGIRDVPVGPRLERLLRERSARRQTSEDSLVFPSRNGTYLLPGNLHKRYLLPACLKANVPAISWHAFRRTHATFLSDMGEPLKIAQAQLGHSNLSTTADIYAKVVPASQRAAVERLERFVERSVDPNGPKSGGLVETAKNLIQ